MWSQFELDRRRIEKEVELRSVRARLARAQRSRQSITDNSRWQLSDADGGLAGDVVTRWDNLTSGSSSEDEHDGENMPPPLPRSSSIGHGAADNSSSSTPPDGEQTPEAEQQEALFQALHDARQLRRRVIRVRLTIIRHARIKIVCQYESCMVFKVRSITQVDKRQRHIEATSQVL